LYESLLMQRLVRELDRVQNSDQVVSVLARIDDAEQPVVLTRHVRDATLRVLSSTRDPLRRVEIVNELLDQLEAEDDNVLEEPRGLTHQDRSVSTAHARVRRCRMLHC
jgi:hypothetical protein